MISVAKLRKYADNIAKGRAMSKKQRLRIRYLSECEIEYTAEHWGDMNDEHTLLDRLGNFLHLTDHGNGVHIEGDGISIDLDYGSMSDLYHVMKAHHDADVYKRGRGIWSVCEDALITVIKPKRKKVKK